MPVWCTRTAIAAKAIFASLPETLAEVGYAGWQDYESRPDRTMRYAYALDKIEPLFELLHPTNELSMKRLKFTLENHKGRKIKATEDFPVMRRFCDVVTTDMVSRDIFCREGMSLIVPSLF